MFAQTLVASVAAATLAACSQPDRAVWMAKDEPRMIAAMTSAKHALPIFWATFDAHDPKITEALVKVGYPTRHGGVEYLWVDVESHGASVLRGRMLNEPEDVTGVHRGDAVSVEISKIGDWAYRKNGKYYGQFTTPLMLENVDAKTRREQSQDLARTPLEPTGH